MLGRIRRLGLEIGWGRAAAAVLLAAVSAIFPVGVPLLLGRAIDAALHGADIMQVLPLLGAMLLIAAIGAAAELGAGWIGTRLGYRLAWSLAERLYAAVLRMPYLSYATVNPGVLNSRLSNDMRMVDPLFTSVPLAIVHGWVGLATVAVGLALVNLWFLAAFLVVPLAILAIRYAEGRINATIRESFELTARAARQVESTTSADAILLVRQARATAAEEGRYAEIAAGSADVASRMDMWRNVVLVAYRFSFDVIAVVFIGIGVVLASAGQVSIGSVVSALLYIGLLRQPLGELVGLRYPLVRAEMGLKRVEEVLQSPNTGLGNVAAVAAAPAPQPRHDLLVFDHVGYSYPARHEIAVGSLSNVAAATGTGSGFIGSVSLTRLEEAAPDDPAVGRGPVLHDISFAVGRGETVAVAGESGAGKSTIISLACGLVRPSAGRILVGGIDASGMAEEDIWRTVSLVSQDVFLRDGTLRENLGYGLERATDADIRDALHLAGLDDLVAGLAEGLDTQVGQRGKRLSGGERQRVAIARAVLHGSDVLILDEATSHLDTRREESILRAMESIARDRAVLVVAHRLSAIARSDAIVMLKQGRVAERGTHAELMAAGGPYARMHLGAAPSEDAG